MDVICAGRLANKRSLCFRAFSCAVTRKTKACIQFPGGGGEFTWTLSPANTGLPVYFYICYAL